MIKRFLHFIVFILGFSCICFVGLYPQTVINKWSNPVNITNLNSPDDEFAPSWNRFENALYYNSIKGNYSKFYKTKLIDSFKFSNAEFLESGLNQPRNNQSYITFTSEDRAYINTFRMGERRPYINIFETILTRAGWSAPMILDSFRYDCNLLHPTVSPDGKLLVFSSDLKSKNGKLDLWIAYMTDNGSWGGFERIDVLNTDGNEITPYFGSNDTLYFASDGQAGPGGYDLFYSVRTPQGFWQKPNPMTELNTASDESDFALLPNKSAVFASNRPGGFGGMDLYYTKLERIEINPMDKSSLDIAIATQVNAIKSINDQTYQLFPIINTIFNDINEIELEGILNSNKHTDSYKTNFDSLYISSLFVIIERMKQYPGANIIINKINYDQEPENTSKINRIANLLKDFFLRNGIDSNYIKFNSLTKRVVVGELSVRPVIIINSDETKIFEPLSIGKNNLTIDPPSIDVLV